MLMEMISILLGIILLGAVDYGIGAVDLKLMLYLVDFPSAIIILALTVPVLLRGGMWKDFLRAWKLLNKKYTCHLSEIRRSLDVIEMMQKQLACAGIIGMLLSFIHILHQLSDLASLGPNIAVAILTMLYATIFEMLLLPLQIEAKRRIIDYMEVDTDAESAGNTAGETDAEGMAAAEEISGTGKECETAVKEREETGFGGDKIGDEKI